MKEDSRLSVSTKQKGTTQLTMQASAVETKTNEPGTPESASVADGEHVLISSPYIFSLVF